MLKLEAAKLHQHNMISKYVHIISQFLLSRVSSWTQLTVPVTIISWITWITKLKVMKTCQNPSIYHITSLKRPSFRLRPIPVREICYRSSLQLLKWIDIVTKHVKKDVSNGTRIKLGRLSCVWAMRFGKGEITRKQICDIDFTVV